MFVDDGSVKIWHSYVPEAGVVASSAQLVTAWQALTDMLPIAKGSGLIVDWDQTSSLMYTSGDVRIIRIWDMETELRVQVSLALLLLLKMTKSERHKLKAVRNCMCMLVVIM